MISDIAQFLKAYKQLGFSLHKFEVLLNFITLLFPSVLNLQV